MRSGWTIAFALPLAVFAQDGTKPVHATLDKQSIRIGEQAVLSVHVASTLGAITWPVVGDTLTEHIEVVQVGAIDTALSGAEFERAFVITSFDTGYWAIPPFVLNIDGQPTPTEPLLLRVEGFAVDSLATPTDIKPIHEGPFSLMLWASDHWRLLAGLAGAGVLAAVILLLVRRRKKTPALVEATAPPLALHERILGELAELDRQRVWQQGEHKAYQSRLTDLLRAYIEERYQVPALERTTDELLHELRVSPLSTDQQGLLSNMLHGADMVKFAKALPSPQENEQLMTAAVRFVRETAANPITDAQGTR